MKRWIMLFLLIPSLSYAQCVAEVLDVIQDPERGSIIVQTQYTLNGQVVQLGQTRYLEDTGTEQEIIKLIRDDIAIHCENLILRIQNNLDFLNAEKLEQQKELTQPVIDSIKPQIIGYTDTKTEYNEEFKGKDITVTYDEKNTVTDSVIIP